MIPDKQLVTAVHTLHQSENQSIDNSLSIKIELQSKDVTFENVPKNSFRFWSASYNAHALVTAAVMYFALVD